MERSELGSRDIHGQAERPSDRERTSQWDQAGNWKAVNFYGFKPDEILGRYDAVWGHLIYKQDKQGNVAFVLSAANQTVEKYTYDAYGTPTILSGNTQLSTSAIGNRFMYTGREWLGELGIYDYRHRYYLPSIGRFLETDPTGFDAGDMNLFRYCGDDPVDRTDPMGLADIAISGEFDRFGAEASLRSYYAGLSGPDAYIGRAQLVMDGGGFSDIKTATVEKVKIFGRGMPGARVRENFGGIVGAVAVGHVHYDVRGRPGKNEAAFSGDDGRMASWQKGRDGKLHPGIPIYKVNESDQLEGRCDRVTRLTPQDNPQAAPQERLVDPRIVRDVQRQLALEGVTGRSAGLYSSFSQAAAAANWDRTYGTLGVSFGSYR